jgi:internalin A
MSKLALRLIKENKKTRATFLDLGNCGLTEMPEGLGDLVWLEDLSFSSEWRDGDELKESQNTGPTNNIRCLTPAVSGLNAIKRLLREAVVASNPFSRLLNLKRIWLIGDWQKRFDLADLSPLAGLVGLQTLDVACTQVADLSPIAGLVGIQTLDVMHTEVADLSPLAKLAGLRTLDVSWTKVTDLSPLAGLVGLQTLDIAHTEVTDLSPLAGLVGLQTLDVACTQVADLSPLAGLADLEELDVGETQVTDLSPLAGLANLQELDVWDTAVADLSPLAGLKNLKRVHAIWTQVADLSPLLPMIRQGIPVKWDQFDDGICVEDCPLANPPAEIVRQGNAAILNYFDEKEIQGVDHLYEAKLLIVGEGRAGKTTLMRRLFQPDKPMPNEADTTKGIDIHLHEFKLGNGRNFRLNVWDFGGQEIYHATHQFFLTKRSLYVLVDDASKDYKTVQDEGFKYWLEVVDRLSDHSRVLIFQNEKGGRSKTIDLAGIKGRFDNVMDCYRGNLEQSGAADKLRNAVEFYASNLRHIGEELPGRWVSIRADIETLAQQKPYISQQEYFELYSKHLKPDREKALFLSRYFHDLGVFLHFQDDLLLAKNVILKNEWATDAVFKMLDDEPVKKAMGRFTLQDCRRVWRDSVYTDMHPELLALMQKFQLCYRLPDISPDTWLIPQLLPPSKPAALAGWESPGDLVLRYRYDFMPRGLISRLIVRLSRFVPQPDMGWVTGVLFERDTTQALVEIPSKGGEIVLRVRGPERKGLLAVIDADLDTLNKSFRLEEDVEKLVPCNCKQCQGLAQPRAFEQRELLRRIEHSIFKVECPGSYKYVDVLELLDGIRLDRLPRWANEETDMTTPPPLKIFISYSKHDNAYKETLLNHLSGLRNKVLTWNDQDLLPGEEWDAKIKEELNKADIVLYLVTANSMATDYIQKVELPLIEERCQTGLCKLVPVIVDFCHWADLNFAKYNALPNKGIPVTDLKNWNNENEAWLNVVNGIRRLVA